MLIIGLTGGIGTGKTQVSRALEDLGAVLVNADLLGHEVYRPHTEGWREVVRAFGEGVLTPGGEIDRGKLGGIVFKDDGALERLNAITHPRIYRMAEERLEGLRQQGTKVAVLEAALLIEAGWTPLADEVWVVTSPEGEVLRRLGERNGLDEASARARIESQMPQDERKEYADVIIENNGSLEELRGRVKELWNTRVLARKENRR